MGLLQYDPRLRDDSPDVVADRGQVVCEISDEALQELHRHCAEQPHAAFRHAMSSPVSASIGQPNDWINGDGSDADILNYALK